MDSYEQRIEIISDLVAGFPSVEVTADNLKTYAWCLGDLTIPILRAAIDRTLNSHKFSTLPTIAEIRENAATVSNGASEAKHSDSCLCWGTGMVQIPRDGTGYSPGAKRCEGMEDADIGDW